MVQLLGPKFYFSLVIISLNKDFFMVIFWNTFAWDKIMCETTLADAYILYRKDGFALAAVVSKSNAHLG